MRKLVGNSAKWVSRMRNSWDSILVENPGRVQPDRFGPPEHRIRMQGTQVEVEVEFCFVLKLELFQFQFQDGVLQICPIFLSLRTENTMTTE